MTMNVTKQPGVLYHIQGTTEEGCRTWGVIAVQFGETSAHVLIDSDYGHFAYYWSHCGCEPIKFLRSMDRHYAMNKFTGGKCSVPDNDARCLEVKKLILELRRESAINDSLAREAWDDLINEDDYEDETLRWIIDSPYFESIFKNDYENLPCQTKFDPHLNAFWEAIWMPFCDFLVAELDGYPQS